MKKITITIDGPAGSGKGTTVKGVAEKLGYVYVDSGGMYRAITHVCLPLGLVNEGPEIQKQLEKIELDISTDGAIILNGQVMGDELRTEEINRNVSTIYARIQSVRDHVTASCQRIAQSGGYILDGRDAATVIAPHAELKIYLDCDPYERARRRAIQWGDESEEKIQEIMNDIFLPRDEADRHDLDAVKAIAVTVDTTNLTIDQQIEQIYQLALEKINEQ